MPSEPLLDRRVRVFEFDEQLGEIIFRSATQRLEARVHRVRNWALLRNHPILASSAVLDFLINQLSEPMLTHIKIDPKDLRWSANDSRHALHGRLCAETAGRRLYRRRYCPVVSGA